jgi:hypothetical protein
MLTRLLTSDDNNSIVEGSLPVLIACLWKDKDFEKNMKKLESIATYFYGKMNIYYALEDMFPYFRVKYGIPGTPTYLILYEGDVLETILGKISIQSLIDHLTIILLAHVKNFMSQNEEKSSLEDQNTELRINGDNQKKKMWELD